MNLTSHHRLNWRKIRWYWTIETQCCESNVYNVKPVNLVSVDEILSQTEMWRHNVSSLKCEDTMFGLWWWQMKLAEALNSQNCQPVEMWHIYTLQTRPVVKFYTQPRCSSWLYCPVVNQLRCDISTCCREDQLSSSTLKHAVLVDCAVLQSGFRVLCHVCFLPIHIIHVKDHVLYDVLCKALHIGHRRGNEQLAILAD